MKWHMPLLTNTHRLKLFVIEAVELLAVLNGWELLRLLLLLIELCSDVDRVSGLVRLLLLVVNIFDLWLYLIRHHFFLWNIERVHWRRLDAREINAALQMVTVMQCTRVTVLWQSYSRLAWAFVHDWGSACYTCCPIIWLRICEVPHLDQSWIILQLSHFGGIVLNWV